MQLLTAAAGISTTTALWMAEGSTLRPELASAISGLKGQMQSAQSEVRLRLLSLRSKAWTLLRPAHRWLGIVNCMFEMRCHS